MAGKQTDGIKRLL